MENGTHELKGPKGLLKQKAHSSNLKAFFESAPVVLSNSTVDSPDGAVSSESDFLVLEPTLRSSNF